MNFDVESNLSAVERSVSSLKKDGQPARAVTISRIFATTPEDLWGAVTSGGRGKGGFIRLCRLTRRQGIHIRQHPGLGASGDCGRR